MIASLRGIPSIKVYEGVANFFLIELLNGVHKADAICNKLQAQKIFIRNCDSMSTQFHNDFVRIAVKGEKDDAKILTAFKGAL